MVAQWHAIGKRFALTLGGEVVQSAFHFALNVLLARMLTAQDYGIFAIVMLIGGVSLTYVRALVGMPVTLLISHRRGSRAARAIESAFGSAALCLAASITVLVGLLLHLWLHADALSAALFVGLWSFRSYLRTMLLAEHRQVTAGLSDLSLALTGGLLAAVLALQGAAGPLDIVFLLLCAANLAGIVVAVAMRGVPLRFTLRASMRRRFAVLGRQLAWSAIGTTTANAQAQGQVLLLASFAGPRAYAPIAAMLVLFAPIRLFSLALANIVQPELAMRAARGELPGLRRMMLGWSSCALLIGGLYGIVAAAALPLMGSTVFEGQPKLMIGLLAWAITTTFLLSLLPRLLLEVLRRFRVAAVITAASAVLGMTAVAILLATESPAWTLFGNLLAESIVLIWSWIAVARPEPSSATASAAAGPDAENGRSRSFDIAEAQRRKGEALVTMEALTVSRQGRAATVSPGRAGDRGRPDPEAQAGFGGPVRTESEFTMRSSRQEKFRPFALEHGPEECWTMHRPQFQDRQEYDALPMRLGPLRPEPADGTSEVGDLWRILWCRRMLILATVVVCSLAALIYVLITPLQFTAVAQVLIDPRNRQIINNDVTPDTLAADGGLLQVESQSRLIESDAVLLRAVRSLNLANDPDYGLPKTGLLASLGDLLTDSTNGTSASDDEDRALRVLRRHLAVKRADKVFVVDIIVTALSSGEKAARIADAIAEAYLADQTQARAQSASVASAALSARLDELRAGVQAAADKVQAYKVAHDLIGTDKQLISDQQLNDNGSQLDAAHARVAELQARADQIDSLRRTGVDGGSIPEAIQSSVITQLRASESELIRKRSDMRTLFGDRHPDLIALNAEIVQARQQIETELDRLARTAHSDLDRAKKNEHALEDSQRKLKLQTTSSDQAHIELQELARELDTRRAVYQSFLSRASETKEQSTIDNSNARIISRAIPPIQPSWPLRAILLVGGLAAGIGLGAALAFVVEYLAPTILSAGHLQGATGAPVIATLSSRGDRGRAGRRGRRGAADHVGTALKLGLNRLCGPLNALSGKGRPHTVLVAAARDVVRANLNVPEALAQAGMRGGASTLLIEDGTGTVGSSTTPRGLLNVLNGECTMKSVILLDRDTGQYRLPLGTSKAGRSDAAIDRQFGSFLDQAGRMFDLVVIDGGNFLDDLGAASIAACVDDVLFVALRGRTPQKAAAEAAEAIAASTGRPVSAALLLDRWAA